MLERLRNNRGQVNLATARRRPVGTTGLPSINPPRTFSPISRQTSTATNPLSGVANLVGQIPFVGGALSGLATGVGQGLSQIPQQIGQFLSNPRNILGSGLIAAAGAQREPGATTEARQFLRNQFTSPTATSELLGRSVQGVTQAFGQFLEPSVATQFQTRQLTSPTDPFAPGGVFATQLPLLLQQEKEQLDRIQARFIAGTPTSLSTAQSGPEIQAIREAATRDIIPRRQALIAQTAETNLERQLRTARDLTTTEGQIRNFVGGQATNLFNLPPRAAEVLLREGTDTSLAQALGQLGGQLLQGGGGQGRLPGTGQGNTLLDQQGRPIGQVTNDGSIIPIGQTGADGFQLNSLQSGQLWQLPNGQVVEVNRTEAEALASAGIGQPATGAATGAPQRTGLATQIGGTLATGAGGFAAGRQFGPLAPNQATAALTGAATGAATGAVIGSIIPGFGTAVGAIVGGIAGAIGGFFGERSQGAAQKQANRTADVSSQAGQLRAIADFFLPVIDGLGGNTSSFMDEIAQLINTIEGPASEQNIAANLLGDEILRLASAQDPSIRRLDDIPTLREKFITFYQDNAWVAPSADTRRAPNIEETIHVVRGATLFLALMTFLPLIMNLIGG